MDVTGPMTREDANEFVNALREIIQDEGTPVGIDIEVNGIVIGCIQNGRKRYHFSAVTEWRVDTSMIDPNPDPSLTRIGDLHV